MSPAIETHTIKRTFDGRPAVDGVDLSVAPGEIYGFLGPNGAGKSTMVRMLCTLLAPTSGTAAVLGHDVAKDPNGVRFNIGVALQDAGLDERQTGREILDIQGRLYGLNRSEIAQRTTDIISFIDLGEAFDQRVATYSGGMKRRLDLAASLVHNPQVLFLDEPTTGLDPQSRIALWEIIGELNEGGQTILLTTHYMEEADQLCDRVAIMDHGRILMLDTPEGLKRSVDADSIITLHADGDLDELVRVLQHDIEGVTSAHVDDDHDPPVVRVLRHGQDTAIGPIVAAAERCACTLHDLSISETTLETVFIALTGKDLRE